METSADMITVVELCKVFPSPETVPEKSLPLTFFDLMYASMHLHSRVLFFDVPYSTTYFTQTLIPNLKTSLSHTLKYFFPLAGNLITPSDIHNSNTTPQILYSKGDSVSVIFADCSGDYCHYSGNHARDADILAPLVPHLASPQVTNSCIAGEDCSVAPVFAIQVTLFPNRGVCFGFTNSHAVMDGNSFFNFTRAWAAINKQLINSDEGKVVNIDELLASGSFGEPSYDRSLIKDSMGIATMLKRAKGAKKPTSNQPNVADQDTKWRATFVLKQAEIQALKKQVSSKRPTLPYVSSFTVVCAYIWTCMAKVRAAGEKLGDDEHLNFGFAIDCRARLDPPLPAAYFGNCLAPCGAREKTEVLVGEEGLFTAAELIGKRVFEKLNGGVLNGADKWLEKEFAGVLRGEWIRAVSGSPNLDYYNTVDFGWGKPHKFEFVSEQLSVSRCKDSKTDLELGFIMPKSEMDVFSTIFAEGLSQSA